MILHSVLFDAFSALPWFAVRFDSSMTYTFSEGGTTHYPALEKSMLVYLHIKSMLLSLIYPFLLRF